MVTLRLAKRDRDQHQQRPPRRRLEGASDLDNQKWSDAMREADFDTEAAAFSRWTWTCNVEITVPVVRQTQDGLRLAYDMILPDVAEVYARLDLVAIPSRYEGFCFTAAEAGLCGLPVVASRVSSLPEVVEDGVSGLLLPPDDASALTAAIASFANDPARRTAMGEAGRRIVQERFSPGPLFDQLESLLRRVASEPPVG